MNNYPITWTPTIGDPSIIGWLTVVLYFLCFAWSCRVYLCANSLFTQPIQRQKNLWLLITITILALGINKQLDLQSLLTQIGKYFAYHNDWYDQRRHYQRLFITSILALSIIAMATLFFVYKPVLRKHYIAIFGLCFLLAFVVIRASSFHNVDELLTADFQGIRFNWAMEISGIFLVSLNAYQLLTGNKHSALNKKFGHAEQESH